MDREIRIGDRYDRFADEYAGFADAPLRRHYEWPAVDALLPALDGRRVLDAACGPGDVAARLADRGADVLGVDASREMVRVARRRHGDAVDVRRADVREPMEFLAGGAVDVVLAQLTLGHVREWEPVLAEFRRVLADDGVVVLSVGHPFSDFLMLRDGDYPAFGGLFGESGDPTVAGERDRPRYGDVERFVGRWSAPTGDGQADDVGGDDGVTRIPFYRRPLAAVFGPLLAAGFAVTGLEEPEPTDELVERDPESARALRRRPPIFLCLRGEKR